MISSLSFRILIICILFSRLVWLDIYQFIDLTEQSFVFIIFFLLLLWFLFFMSSYADLHYFFSCACWNLICSPFLVSFKMIYKINNLRILLFSNVAIQCPTFSFKYCFALFHTFDMFFFSFSFSSNYLKVLFWFFI